MFISLIVTLIVTLIVVGLVFYFIDQIPLDPIFKVGIRIVAIVIVLLLILQVFGLTAGLPTLR